MEPKNSLFAQKTKSSGFQSLKLIYPLYKAILQKGFRVPTPIQRKAIPAILDGHDTVICSRTGSGKTAAFAIPVINKLKEHSKIVGIRALIISPTRELALQTSSMVKQFLKNTNLVQALVVGGHDFEGQFESLAFNPDIVIATPGRLMQHIIELKLGLSKLEFLIFDEADQLFEMGFGDQIDVILEKVPSTKQTIIVSATIPENLHNFVKTGLKDQVLTKLDSEQTISENVEINFFVCKANEKVAALIYLVKEIIEKDKMTIIFVSTRYHVELLLEILQKQSVSCGGIQGKMDQEARDTKLKDFRKQKIQFLIVTDIAARGLDIPQVENIIHYDFPQKTKVFVHRSGRTGRMGKRGTVQAIFTSHEVMYIAEILLQIGRKIEFTNNCDIANSAFCGAFPNDVITQQQESVGFCIENNEEVRKQYEASEKAFKMFQKMRASASKESKQKAKLQNFNTLHPRFKEAQTKENKELFERVSNFKPKQSFLEQKSIKEQNEDFMKFSKNIKSFCEEKQLKRKKDLEKSKEKEEIGSQAPKVTKRKFKNESKILENSPDFQKQIKKSKITDFRHPTQQISNDISDTKALDQTKISNDEVNAFVVADDVEEILKNRPKHAWQIVYGIIINRDKTKRRFVKGKLNEKGKMKKDREDLDSKKMRATKSQKNWSKKQLLGKAKEGEEENPVEIEKAKQLFNQRIMQSKFTRIKKKKIKKPKQEVKKPQQILSDKLRNKKLKYKNLERWKKRQNR